MARASHSELRAERVDRRGPATADQGPRDLGPRIYVLRAPHAARWREEVPRIASMGFDWVHAPGLLRQPHSTAGGRATADFVAHARAHKLRVMTDVAISTPADVEAWAARIADSRRIGIDGFLCRRAHRLPAEAWRTIIARARGAEPRPLVVAETLGTTADHAEALAAARFDYFINSARWWDFRTDWLFEQQERLHRIAPTIAFSDDPGGERLTSEFERRGVRSLEAAVKFHLLFVASISGGWMMGDAGDYDAEDINGAAHPGPDLTDFIASINAARIVSLPLNREGALLRVTAPGKPVAGLLRLPAEHVLRAPSAALILCNSDPATKQRVALGPLLSEAGGRYVTLRDITASRSPLTLAPDEILELEPLEIRIFELDEAIPSSAPSQAPPNTKALHELARNRVVIEAVSPCIDGGRYPAKRIVGDALEVRADIFMDGHAKIAACVKYRAVDEQTWQSAPMRLVDNDRWGGRFTLTRNTTYHFTVEAWEDHFATWQDEFRKKEQAGQDTRAGLDEGMAQIAAAAARAGGQAREDLEALTARHKQQVATDQSLAAALLSSELGELMGQVQDRGAVSTYGLTIPVVVDRLAARYSTWYELFPRSLGRSGRHGSFDDVIRHLPYVRDMGFDVLYFPPIHPIGRKNRKGRNNSLTAAPGDPGSPYAIGSEAGGHTGLHPELGTLADFHRLVEAAHAHGLEIAIDFAVQCSLDHPWVREHPEWFSWRADGSIKFAENPPKKYEDIVNPNFYGKAFPAVWLALREVVLFWVAQGVRIFRVDNPHTKPVPFWEWLIGEVLTAHPDVVFLSEAFTRPKMMKRLAKVGFTQSYTYFTWRNTKRELTEYMTELAQSEQREYFRPNFFANTPDINPLYLQSGGRAAFIVRATLAATLSSAYGIYSGFEVCEAAPLPGREEYLDAEKYELRSRDWNQPGNIRDHIARLNRIRRDNPALHDFANLRFYNAWDDHIIVYGKSTPARDNTILVAVNVDPRTAHACDFEVPLWEFGLPDSAAIEVEDLLERRSFTWTGKIQHVHLDPVRNPVAIWRLTAPEATP
jgi:starch synthase (maltosyl-transferring)